MKTLCSTIIIFVALAIVGGCVSQQYTIAKPSQTSHNEPETNREKVSRFIDEADNLAKNHNYEASLNKLEQAYDLNRSAMVDEKIVKKHSEYLIDSIAWDISTKGNLLEEKTVSVTPFIGQNSEGDSQGEAIASELINKLTNLNILKVYTRNDVVLKSIFEELEGGQTGFFNADTIKEIGKLVSTEAIITGRVAYFANIYKIYALMIDVETGRILSSKSVIPLGTDVKDTSGDADFKISVSTGKPKYKIGETGTIHFTSNKDCYVTILDKQSTGEIWELFPNKYHPDNLVRANERLLIPSKNDDFELAIDGPVGVDTIKAIATTKKITIDDRRRSLRSDSSILTRSSSGIAKRGSSLFRESSSVDMRSWHKVLRTRSMYTRPKTNSSHEESSYTPSNSTGFDSAVSSCKFETVR